MTWRTCGSLRRSSERSAYSTRAVGWLVDDGRRPKYCGRLALVTQLAQAARQLGGGAERRRAVAAHEARDRRVIDTGLLRQLALRHLLRLELGPQPLVEGPTVLDAHGTPTALSSHRHVPAQPPLGSRPIIGARMRRRNGPLVRGWVHAVPGPW